MEHYSDLQKIYQKIYSRIQSSKKIARNKSIFRDFPIILKVLIYIPIIIALLSPILLKVILPESELLVIIFTQIACFALFWQFGFIQSIILLLYYNKLTNINKLLRTNIQSIEDAQLILRKVEAINHLYKYKLYYFLDSKIIPLELQYFILLLTDLRSDLSIRLAEQQSTLESAKSEVEKNIAGTTELNEVSELQRARLDRQIEQFEELQRVLVKI